jgi:hypothetical protein
MIPKSGNRFSDKIMLKQKDHTPGAPIEITIGAKAAEAA